MKRRALVSAALGLVTAGLLVFAGAGLVRVWQMKQGMQALELEIRNLRAEADRLTRTVDRLREDPALIEQIARPGQEATSPSSSSIRRSWLYLAVRSPRASDPVLICPAFTATARSATKVSSVSPDR